MGVRITDTAVRALFISDLHLGSRACQPSALQAFLEAIQPEKLYIVGDFCDGWLLRRRWRWPEECQRLVETIQDLYAHGTDVFYVMGNHDRCLHRWVRDWGDFWIGEQCIHRCSDGRDVLVIHGDQFDGMQHRFRATAGLTAVLHEGMLGGSRLANRALARLGMSQQRLATALTLPFKTLAHSLGQFRGRAKDYALQHGCEGVLCGHTHAPRLQEGAGFIYLNTGDWLEHCSVVVERQSGQLELWAARPTDWFGTCRRLAVSPPVTTRPACLINA